ncbi:PH domain-containing protein [Streptomyces sp. NPDC056159]|uniref:PH domain-containing protein n=1 Tax=unclassified Streptomyces TaxID=2593676 RepID=UPI0034224EDB
MRAGRAERRRQARKERRDRVKELAGAMTAPEVPLVWRAGWGGRVTSAVVCVVFVLLSEHEGGGSMAHPRPVGLIFSVWPSLIVGWVCCWLALWRVTADRDGVYIRRLLSTRFLPWSRISRVEMRHDGQLEFFSQAPEPMAGLFAPPWLSRVTRRPGTGGQAADMLTAMARHGDLRPTAQAERAQIGGGLVPWVFLVGVVLHLAVEFLPHWSLA